MDPLYPVSPYEKRESLISKGSDESLSYARCPGRIAVYEEARGAAPRIIEIQSGPTPEFLESLASKTYELAHAAGGSIPYTVIREIVENFIHAHFNEPVVSVYNKGDEIRFSDQGPGIKNKEKAALPGFTSATQEMKSYIRGVGSGLPLVNDFLSLNGGSFLIEDNVGTGTVVTIKTASVISHPQPPQTPLIRETPQPTSDKIPRELSSRQLKILTLMLEGVPAGPTSIAQELDISIATAHRDLDMLEKQGFVAMRDDRKRVLTDEGYTCLTKRLL